MVGYNDYLYTYATEGGPPHTGTPASRFTTAPTMESLGFYADDSFRASSRLTVNAGLRYDHSRAFYRPYPILDARGKRDGDPQPAANDRLFNWDTVSPRIGFNLQAHRPTATRYSAATMAVTIAGIISGEFDQRRAFHQSPVERHLGLRHGAFDPESLALSRRLGGADGWIPASTVSSTDQFLVGFERELFKDVVLAIGGTYKRGASATGGWKREGRPSTRPPSYVDDQGQDATGKVIRVTRLLSDPGAPGFRPHESGRACSPASTGVVVQATKRMSHGWQLASSLTLGRATGRVGSSNQPAQATQSGLRE